MRLRDTTLPMMLGSQHGGTAAIGAMAWRGARPAPAATARRHAPPVRLSPFAFQLVCLAVAAVLVGATLA